MSIDTIYWCTTRDRRPPPFSLSPTQTKPSPKHTCGRQERGGERDVVEQRLEVRSSRVLGSRHGHEARPPPPFLLRRRWRRRQSCCCCSRWGRGGCSRAPSTSSTSTRVPGRRLEAVWEARLLHAVHRALAACGWVGWWWGVSSASESAPCGVGHGRMIVGVGERLSASSRCKHEHEKASQPGSKTTQARPTCARIEAVVAERAWVHGPPRPPRGLARL